MATLKKLSKKHLLSWIMNNQEKFTQGNNLQETDLEVSLNKGILKAEFICRNGLGSIWSCESWLVIECPKEFIHLFSNNSMINFEL